LKVHYLRMFPGQIKKPNLLLLAGLLLATGAVLATGVAAQSHPKPKAATTTPTFETTAPNYVYPQTIGSMLEFDTKNAALVLFDSAGKPATTAKLLNGVFEDHQKDGGYTNIRFNDYQYFEYFNEQPNHALASIVWSTTGPSGTSSVGLLQVFEVRDGHPVATQQIRFNRMGEGVGVTFNAETLSLTVRGIHGWERGGADIDIGKFRWDGKKFVLQNAAARK